jgi:outer membrane protein insertion porin family
MPKLWSRFRDCLRVLAVGGLLLGGSLGATVVVMPDVALAQAIRDVRVVGNQRLTAETVRSYLQFSVGDAYDAGKVDRSLKALFNTGLFADVRIDRDGNGVLVTVVENPVVAQVAFEGNREIDRETLMSEVQLKPRTVYTRARALNDVQRILDIYRRRGLYAASVEPKLIELDQNRVNVVFEINEGRTTKVKSISFIGNRAFSDGQLRDIISTSQAGWFDFLKTNTVYDPDRLSLDRELLRQYYLKNGYADMRVVSANAELDRDGSGFIITFSIDEGELYRFGDVKIETRLPNLNTATLRGDTLTQPGAFFNSSDLEKTVERLTLVVAERGYPFVRVRPDTDRQPASRVINVTYFVEEGPRVYIERINISGNVRTKDHVIRREFRLAEGDAFNPAMVDRAKRRLQSLGFFKTVDIKRRPGFAQDRVILDVEVVEQPTGELSFGAGYSTTEGVIGDVSFTERNLFGNGQFLRLKVGGSTSRQQIDLSFTEPRFLDRNLAAGFDLFYKDLNQTSTSSFKSRKIGGSLRLGFPLSDNLWMNTAYTLSYDDIYYVDTATASRAILQAYSGGRPECAQPDGLRPTSCDGAGAALTSAIGTSLTYDTRNHPRNPNRGWFFQAGPEFAGVGGDVQYVRLQGEGRAYYPVADKVTLVGRVIGGHIEGWGGQDVRLLDLFYRGGETVRGFYRAGIGPRDGNTRDALGGQTYWAATAELRFPLPLIPEELGISGAVFADAGSVFGASEAVKRLPQSSRPDLGNRSAIFLQDDSTIRSSVGASIMWQSPVGPLRLDYAHVLSKESYDRTQAIRFGASTNF